VLRKRRHSTSASADLLATDHLERTQEGGLILGLAGERVVRNFRFLATFQDTTEWAVKDGTRDVGTVGSPVPQGERLALAGRTWEVVEVLTEQHVLVVRRVRGALRTHFVGGDTGAIHDRIAERMRQTLTEDVVYPYLTARAAARLAEARESEASLRVQQYSPSAAISSPCCRGLAVESSARSRYDFLKTHHSQSRMKASILSLLRVPT